MSPFKEPHFFARFENTDSLPSPYIDSLKPFGQEQNYLELFKDAGNKPAVGEASTGYLPDELAPVRIRERIPDANIIIMLRDPVERAYSHYSLLAIYGHERKPFYQALLDDQARHGKLLGQARLYVEQGLNFDGIKRYLDTFGSRKVRIYLTEDFSTDSAKMLEDVCEFLALPFSNGDFFDPHRNYNYSRPPRNAAIRWVKSSRLLRS